jgi:hypothetical protein
MTTQEVAMRRIALAVASAALVGAGLAAAAPAQAVTSPLWETVPASGTFSFSTANGILPTWGSEDIVLVGISPGSAVTTSTNTSARVSLPIVAKTGSANAAAGGFRLSNTVTGQSVRCSTPTIDTRARVVDCVLADGTNARLLAISSIRSRSLVSGSSTITTIYRGVTLRINGQVMADRLNQALDTTAFSPYVTVGIGDLIVTRDR